MVKFLGITIGERKDEDGKPQGCKHPLLNRGMRLNPEKQEMEVYCKQCGKAVEDGA